MTAQPSKRISPLTIIASILFMIIAVYSLFQLIYTGSRGGPDVIVLRTVLVSVVSITAYIFLAIILLLQKRDGLLIVGSALLAFSALLPIVTFYMFGLRGYIQTCALDVFFFIPILFWFIITTLNTTGKARKIWWVPYIVFGVYIAFMMASHIFIDLYAEILAMARFPFSFADLLTIAGCCLISPWVGICKREQPQQCQPQGYWAPGQMAPAPPSAPSVQQARTGVADELKAYKELLDQGIITQEEFDAKKKQLLGL